MSARRWFIAASVIVLAIIAAFLTLPAYNVTTSSEACSNDVANCDDGAGGNFSETIVEANGWRPVLTLLPLAVLCLACVVHPRKAIAYVTLTVGVVTSLLLASMLFVASPVILMLILGLGQLEARDTSEA